MKRPLLIGAVVLGAGGLAAYGARHLRALHSRRKHREDTFPVGGMHVGLADSAVGVMAQAVRDGAFTQPAFVDVPLGDLTISVGTDMLKKDGLRLMVSWPETIEIAKGRGWIAPSKKIADAIYAAAPTHTAFHSLVTASDPSSGGEKMHTLDFARRYNQDVDSQLSGWDGTTLQSGAEKYWLLSPRLAETVKATGAPAAVNYGGWSAQGTPLQSPGAMHDVNYPGDYSQLYRPIARYAHDAQGNQVDLLDWMVANDSVPAQFADLFRGDSSTVALNDLVDAPSEVVNEIDAASSTLIEDAKAWLAGWFA